MSKLLFLQELKLIHSLSATKILRFQLELIMMGKWKRKEEEQ